MTAQTALRAGLAGLAILAFPGGASAGAPAPASEPAGQSGRNLVGEDVASYVRMEPVSTAIQIGRRSGVRAMLEVTFALDAPSRGARRSIDQRRLWLRAAYAETLLIYAGRMYRWGDVPDADMIARLLQAETDRYLGEGEAQVLLDTVMIHAG